VGHNTRHRTTGKLARPHTLPVAGSMGEALRAGSTAGAGGAAGAGLLSAAPISAVGGGAVARVLCALVAAEEEVCQTAFPNSPPPHTRTRNSQGSRREEAARMSSQTLKCKVSAATWEAHPTPCLGLCTPARSLRCAHATHRTRARADALLQRPAPGQRAGDGGRDGLMDGWAGGRGASGRGQRASADGWLTGNQAWGRGAGARGKEGGQHERGME